ncbi:MAG: hypothetical protein V4461_13125 [Pseudomonadota bacterium]
MTDKPAGWEPDPRAMGNWRAMFDTKRQSGAPHDAPPIPTQADVPSETPPDDEALVLDLSVYRPWIVQRGRSRPALMLDFRRYEPRSGLWSGWAIAYPYLVGMEYTGDTLLSLDFGARQIVIEGKGLDELVRYIQQGSVTAVQEYAPRLWPEQPSRPTIISIRDLGKAIPQR